MSSIVSAIAEPSGKLTKADFIRSLPTDVPTESVIEQGAKAGLEISSAQVRQIRSAMRSGKKPKKRKGKKSKAELAAIRKQAGRKAADTKARLSGKPPKRKEKKAKSTERRAYLFTGVDGIMKTPALMKKVNQAAEEALVNGILQLGTGRVREILERVEKLASQV